MLHKVGLGDDTERTNEDLIEEEAWQSDTQKLGKTVSKDKWHIYETLCGYASTREKEAADAERGSIKYKQVEYMSSKIGEVFDGTVSGLADWGFL